MSERRLTLEQFATLSAAMDSGVPHDKVLADAKVSPDAWEQSQAAWLERMAEQSSRGRLSLAERYAKLFAEARLALEKKRVERVQRVDGPPPAAPPPVRLPLLAPAAFAARAPERAPAALAPAAPRPAPPASQPRPSADFQPPPPSVSPPSSHARPAPPAMASSPAPIRPPAMGEQLQAQLTLEQFASLRAELALSPAPTHDEIRARYKLDDMAFRREESAWQQKLTTDKALLQRYMQHFQYMRGLLAPR